MKLPQLSLRDLFWLVLVCALSVGWWVDRGRLAKALASIAIREKFVNEGSITAVDLSRRQVEISLGSDDGVKIGDILDVRQGDTFVAEVVITKRSPDKSVADVTLQGLRSLSIQKGDRALLEYYRVVRTSR